MFFSLSNLSFACFSSLASSLTALISTSNLIQYIMDHYYYYHYFYFLCLFSSSSFLLCCASNINLISFSSELNFDPFFLACDRLRLKSSTSASESVSCMGYSIIIIIMSISYTFFSNTFLACCNLSTWSSCSVLILCLSVSNSLFVSQYFSSTAIILINISQLQ